MAAADIHYPLSVIYCGVCTMPCEYCEYGPELEKCRLWWREHHPDELSEVCVDQVTAGMEGSSVSDDSGSKKKQTRGGKALRKAKKEAEGPKKITISRVARNKRKWVTVISGLKTYEIDLKKASKTLASHFSCGSSVTGEDEVVVQGDVTDDLVDFLLDKYPQVDEETVECTDVNKK
ncbi:density-regulated protein-like [Corticium candelabrum]|uniref:density-regulated protein-like n=1 Tax=Corticium candelabrum TaxID=121492 RepID=UPI002E26C891|nr:density-regulated protein-like [Corticium candelabrum]